MKHYFVVPVSVSDDSWVADYVPNVNALVHKHGGAYIAVGVERTIWRDSRGQAIFRTSTS